MRRARTALVAALAALAAGPGAAAAQGWSLEARAGRLDFGPAGDIAPAATSLGLTLGHESATGWLRASTGVPLGEEDPVWGAADFGRRIATHAGPVLVGVDVAAQGFLQRYRQAPSDDVSRGPLGPVIEGQDTWGSGLAARALPFATVDIGPARLSGRVGASWYRSALGEQAATRTVGMGDMRLSVQPSPWLTLAADARRFEADEGAFTYAGGTAMVGTAAVRVWGSIGQWLDADSLDAVPWSAGAGLALAERLELTVDAREVALDPVYGSAPRRGLGVGLRVRFGADRTARPPVPSSYDGTRATITLPASAASDTPRIAGDFNDWTPVQMRRDGGRWSFTVALEPGVYEYAFVSPDGTWFVPESVPGRVDDGMGGHVARLVVEAEADR